MYPRTHALAMPNKVAYIVNDAGAKALVASAAKGELAEAIVPLTTGVEPRLAFGGEVSGLKLAIHAAAPCPVEVKQKMIDWWGPILVEYYAGTEGHGMTMITSPRWERWLRPSQCPAFAGTPRSPWR